MFSVPLNYDYLLYKEYDIIIKRGERIETILKNINKLISADNIALLSVIITILIFIISRHIEIRYKRHDDKKVQHQYLKLTDLMQKSLSDYKKRPRFNR